MTNTRLYEMFQSLNHIDYKRFEEIVRSPFFNKSERVCRLWAYLKEKGDMDDNFTIEKISAAVFGNEKFNNANLRMVISSFVKLIEEFMLEKEYEQNEPEAKIRLLEIFLKKGLVKSYSKYLNEIERELDKTRKKDSTYYYRKYYVECLKIASGKGGDKIAAREYKKSFQKNIN